MIRIITFCCAFICCLTTYGQVGINTTFPSDAAVLEVASSHDGVNFGGFMPPRVTLLQRAQINAGLTDDGLLIYLINGNERCIQMYNATDAMWENVHCQPMNERPVASTLTFTGALVVGETLTASFTYSDNEGDAAGAHIYTWYAADDASGLNETQLLSGPLNTYTLLVTDNTKYISVEVTPMALTGTLTGFPVQSLYQGPVLLTAPVPEELASWDFNGNTGSEATVNATAIATNVQGGVISRGTGISASGNANRFNANNFTQSNLANALANNDYFQFNITPVPGNFITITEIMFNYERSGTGPQNATLRSSVDGYTSDLASFTGLADSSQHTIDLSTSGITNQGSTVTFRFYFYGNTNAGGTAGFEGTANDLVITGTIN